MRALRLQAGFLPHAVLIASAALVFAAVDLSTKWTAVREAPETVAYHPRSPGYVPLALLTGGALALLVPLVRSAALDLGAAAILGGAIGNAASAVAWQAGVPDFVRLGGIIFNLADVLVWAGLAMLLVAAASLLLDPDRRQHRFEGRRRRR